MIENKFIRAPYPEHPGRCQAVGQKDQCPYMAVEGGSYCLRHGGATQRESNRQEAIRNYRLAKWQERVGQFADNDQVKSLREEIGVLRMLLEETVVRCAESTDLLIHSSTISDLVMKLEKLVASCHRLETASGQLLDRAAALQLASKVVEIVGRHVSDAEALDRIAQDIAEAKPEDQ